VAEVVLEELIQKAPLVIEAEVIIQTLEVVEVLILAINAEEEEIIIIIRTETILVIQIIFSISLIITTTIENINSLFKTKL
jgi:hypothetical protein